MFNVDDPHQFFQVNDDNDVMICRWTMDKIARPEGTVWLMNHFFINPDANEAAVLDEEMQKAMFIARETKTPIWPLDPMIIEYFTEHPEFNKIWYHKPDSK